MVTVSPGILHLGLTHSVEAVLGLLHVWWVAWALLTRTYNGSDMITSFGAKMAGKKHRLFSDVMTTLCECP